MATTIAYWNLPARQTTTIAPKQGTLLKERWDRRGYDPTVPANQRRYWGGNYNPKTGESS